MKKFNREKALRELKFKKKWKKYSRYVYIAIPCITCLTLGIYFAYSKFFVTEEQDIVQTKVNDFLYGDVIINNYINGTYSVDAPANGTGYKVDKIVCDNGAIGEWNIKDWGPTITSVTKRSKCNIYFVDVEKIKIGNVDVLVDGYSLCPSVNDDGSVNVTEAETQYGYLCKAKDAYGDSYYYRGNVTNNYVLFAGFYWRIVRINGDGTVRVIYDGTSAHANGSSSTDSQIGESAFNSSYTDNAYVGYMYGKIGASTYAETHANTNNSTIKTYLDTWYENNIKGTANEQYIADNIFCNDRSLASNNEGTGAGKSVTYYRWYNDAGTTQNSKMMLTCPQKNDAFTVSDTSKGNGALTYSIGLLTADEAAMAGIYNYECYYNYGYDGNYSNYLCSIRSYWLASPDNFYVYNDDYYGAAEQYVHFDGVVTPEDYVNEKRGARPIINLTSEILKNGDGSASNPYHAS